MGVLSWIRIATAMPVFCYLAATNSAGFRYDGSAAVPTRAMVVLAFTAVVLPCAPACATGARHPEPVRGSLTVGVTTTGAAKPGLTFRLTVEPDGLEERVKADAGVFTRDDLPIGDHVVRLTEIPAGCTVSQGAERKISLTEQRRILVVRFEVRCR
jgi:hypothetical protein